MALSKRIVCIEMHHSSRQQACAPAAARPIEALRLGERVTLRAFKRQVHRLHIAAAIWGELLRVFFFRPAIAGMDAAGVRGRASLTINSRTQQKYLKAVMASPSWAV